MGGGGQNAEKREHEETGISLICSEGLIKTVLECKTGYRKTDNGSTLFLSNTFFIRTLILRMANIYKNMLKAYTRL